MMKTRDAVAVVEAMLGRELTVEELRNVDTAAKFDAQCVLLALRLSVDQLFDTLVSIQKKTAALGYLAGLPDEEKIAETIQRVEEARG